MVFSINFLAIIPLSCTMAKMAQQVSLYTGSCPSPALGQAPVPQGILATADADHPNCC